MSRTDVVGSSKLWFPFTTREFPFTVQKQNFTVHILLHSYAHYNVKCQTRWYPWGIQQLVSTYSNLQLQTGLLMGCSGKSKPKVPRSGKISIFKGGGVPESQNPKCQDLAKFQFSGERGVLESQNPKCQDLAKFQLGGGGGFGTKFQNRGVLSNLVKKILEANVAFTSQIVSHILRMWRLMKQLCDSSESSRCIHGASTWWRFHSGPISWPQKHPNMDVYKSLRNVLVSH